MMNKIEPLPDMEEDMVGICGTCGHQVELKRWEAMPPSRSAMGSSSNEFGAWNDLWYCECLACKEVSSKIKTSLIKASGSKIYLMPKEKKKDEVPKESNSGN